MSADCRDGCQLEDGARTTKTPFHFRKNTNAKTEREKWETDAAEKGDVPMYFTNPPS